MMANNNNNNNNNNKRETTFHSLLLKWILLISLHDSPIKYFRQKNKILQVLWLLNNTPTLTCEIVNKPKIQFIATGHSKRPVTDFTCCPQNHLRREWRVKLHIASHKSRKISNWSSKIYDINLFLKRLIFILCYFKH